MIPHAFIGKMAGILSLVGFIPYILATIKGQNRPNRATWIVWFVVGVILLASYHAAGATDTLWVSVTNVIFCGTVLALSFKYGEGGWNFLDVVCLIGAALGLFLWKFFHSPLPALYLSILIDFVGALPTLKKSYQDPIHEDRLTWILFWLSNTVNLFAIGTWSLQIAAYPLYLFLISGTIMVILTLRKKASRLRV